MVKADYIDAKMRKQVGKPLKKAEGLAKKSIGLVKRAEKSNAKLADYDEKYRDPIIDKYKRQHGKA